MRTSFQLYPRKISLAYLLLGLIGCGYVATGSSSQTTTLEPSTSTSGTITTGTTASGLTAETNDCQPTPGFTSTTWQIDDIIGAKIGQDIMSLNVGPGLGLGDLDGDGDLDLFVAIPDMQSLILFNDGTGVLEPDHKVKSDKGQLPLGVSVHLADLNGDQTLDVVLGQRTNFPDQLLFNDGTGRSFDRKYFDYDWTRESKTTTLADFNGDQTLDIFVCGFAVIDQTSDFWKMGGTDNALYLQTAPGTFTQSHTLPTHTLDSLCYHGLPADIDRDGDIDLYLINDHGRDGFDPNALLLNDGTGSFIEAKDCDCDLAMAGMGGGIGDVNEDGWPDMVITDIGPLVLLISDNGTSFYQAAAALGMQVDHTPHAGWGVTFVDLDQDSFEDVAAVVGGVSPLIGQAEDELESYEDFVLMSTQDGLFMDQSTEWGFEDNSMARSIVVGDLNGDGYPDLVTAGFRYVTTWINKGADCRRGITLRLEGPAGNSHGFGAEVIVTIGNRVLHRWMWPSTMYSSSAPELYLGLGTAMQADTVEVYWPGGAYSLLKNVEPGTVTVSIKEK